MAVRIHHSEAPIDEAKVIDVEFEETPMPERPREARTVSLPKAAANLGRGAAQTLDAIGLDRAAAHARTGAAVAEAAGHAAEAIRPAMQSLKDFHATLKEHGLVGATKRPPLGPRNKPKAPR